MKKFYIFLKFCFYSFIILTATAAAGIYGLFWHFSKDLPKIDSLKDYTPPVISEVFANDGKKVGEFWIERRILLDPEEMPRNMTDAIIASEDDRFWEHSGIDYIGIFRAMIENLKAHSIVQGGSTITQQVVKSLVLSNERTYVRKFKEAILAKRLEDKLSKDEILHLYLNQIFFGNRAYGVEAAAQNYFHKSAKELNIAEAAMIAGLAKAPSLDSPIKNFNRAKSRQEYVIDRMLNEDLIDEAQASKAKAFPLTLYKAPTDKEFNKRYAPWFVEEVRRQIIKKYGDRVPYTHGLKIYTTLDLQAQKAADQALWRGLTEIHKRHGYNGPLKHLESSEFEDFIFKTHKKLFRDFLDPDFFIRGKDEDLANKPTQLQFNKMYEALVIEVDTDAMLVQVGQHKGKIIRKDFGWARKRNNASSGWNDAIYLNNAKERFSRGDVIEVKLIDNKKDSKNYNTIDIYFSLEETPQIEGALVSYNPHSGHMKALVGGKNFSPDNEFNRATQAVRQTGSVFKPFLYAGALDKNYKTDTIIEDSPIRIPDGPHRYWEPKNYGGGYRGPMTFQSALVFSRNVVSAKIMIDVGVEYIAALIRKLGVTTDIAKVYSMALGSNDMKPIEVARAFGVFPTGGILPELIYVKRITDRFGTTLEENQPRVVKNFVDQLKDGDLRSIGTIEYDNQNIEQYLKPELWEQAKEWIQKDKLTSLTPFEKIILYGRQIPDGYAMNPRTAYAMVGLMQAIVRSGTGYKVSELKRPAAGKTGTTNELTDCWFIGYVPDLVAGVWTGYDENINKVGGGETGGKAAAPIFLYYMQDYLKDKPIKDFQIPKEVKAPELDSPVPVYPGNIDHLIENPLGDGSGADYFIDDI